MADTTPLRSAKGRSWKAASACPASSAGPATSQRTPVQNGIMSGLDWFPTFLAAAGNPDITKQLLKGVTLGDRTYKNHLDGYDQTAMITGKGPSTRHEIFYLGKAPSAPCALTTISSASSTSPMAGSATRPIPTCPTSLTCASIRSSAWAGRTTGRKTEDSNTSIGSSSISGVLCSSNKSLVRNSKPSWITRRCSGAELQSRRNKSGDGKRMQQAEAAVTAPATSRNDLHGGRLARAARPCALGDLIVKRRAVST